METELLADKLYKILCLLKVIYLMDSLKSKNKEKHQIHWIWKQNYKEYLFLDISSDMSQIWVSHKFLESSFPSL